MSYEEEDTCVSYEEEDTCHMRRRIHVCHMRRRIHVCHMRRRIHVCHMRRRIHVCHIYTTLQCMREEYPPPHTSILLHTQVSSTHNLAVHEGGVERAVAC
jgi:hypothetical protein